MNEKLNFEAYYPHPPERVWKAITDPVALASWLLPTDFRPVIGLRFRFEAPQRGSKVTGEVVEVQPGKRLQYTWDDGEAGSPSLVTWSLQPKDGGTLVRLGHASAQPVEPYVLIESNLNWRYALYASLPVLLGLMRAGALQTPVPIVYVPEETREEPKRRAGFRQEEETICR